MANRIKYFKNGHDDPKWSVLLGLLAIVAAIGLGMRALDTGSWQQYGLTFVFAIYALNRLIHTVVYSVKGKPARS